MAVGFYGTFTPRLDDKGRVTIPARYRKAFTDGAMIVRGDTRCLYLFTVEGFDEFAEDAINTRVTDTRHIGAARYMLANSDFQTLDSQGRVLLSSRMRDYAELARDVVMTGQGRRMEIWNVDRWSEYEAQQEPGYIDPSLIGVRPDSAAASAGEPTDPPTEGAE